MRLLRGTSSDALPLTLACVFVFASLCAITVAGTFTVDESHYLATIEALRGGTFRLESTRALSPSIELLSFGAYAYLIGGSMPVAPVAPPLYAFVALPFSMFGFRALIVLNTLSFVLTGVLVFRLAKYQASRRITAWGALLLFWFGGFSLEYAVGMWPHSFAVLLTTSALVLIHRAARTSGRTATLTAAAAGLCIGLATGVRYQEILLGALFAVTLGYWTRERDGVARAAKSVAAFAAGVVPALIALSYVNHARLGTWNPVTKGIGYAQMSRTAPGRVSAPVEWLWTFAAKVIDFSLVPSFDATVGGNDIRPSYAAGAIVYGGVVKKALLQSAPWMMLVFLGLALSWRHVGGLPDRARSELRGLSFPIFGTLIAFALGGFGRTEGYCYNMRYFLELVPLAAVACAWIVQRFVSWRLAALNGMLAGAVIACAAMFLAEDSALRHQLILRAPLVLSAGLAVTTLHARRTDRGILFGPMLGACVAWAVIVHIGSDLLGSLRVRARHEFYFDIVRDQFPNEPSALFAHWAATTPFSPLTLNHDLIIADTMLDDGKTARSLSDELLRQGRRVFLIPQKMPAPIVNELTRGRHLRTYQIAGLTLVEAVALPLSSPEP